MSSSSLLGQNIMRQRLDMTSTIESKGRISKNSRRESAVEPREHEASPVKPVVRRLSSSSSANGASAPSMRAPSPQTTVRGLQKNTNSIGDPQSASREKVIQQCVQQELRRYFDMLDGEEPSNLYRMVVKQVEHALIDIVMQECRGNQTRASEWLGISRGNLRTKLSNMDN